MFGLSSNKTYGNSSLTEMTWRKFIRSLSRNLNSNLTNLKSYSLFLVRYSDQNIGSPFQMKLFAQFSKIFKKIKSWKFKGLSQMIKIAILIFSNGHTEWKFWKLTKLSICEYLAGTVYIWDIVCYISENQCIRF